MMVNPMGLDISSIFGNRVAMAEIWFAPYMTKITPTRIEEVATPMRSPAELDIAIRDRLLASDWIVSLSTV